MIAGKKGRKYLQEVSFTLFTFLSFLLLFLRLISIVLLYFLSFLRLSIIVFFLGLLPLSQGCLVFFWGLFLIFIVAFFHLFHSTLYLLDIIAFVGKSQSSYIAIILVEDLFIFLLVHLQSQFNNKRLLT